jgi:hypothetical protein
VEINFEHDKRRDRTSDRAATIEQRSSQSAFTLGKPFAYNLSRSWPVPGFPRSQKRNPRKL